MIKQDPGCKIQEISFNSFSVCAHLNIAKENMYSDAGDEQNPLNGVDKEKNNKHKEKGEGRRKLDEADQRMKQIRGRSQWSWRSTRIPSMSSIQVSLISAMAKWRPRP